MKNLKNITLSPLLLAVSCPLWAQDTKQDKMNIVIILADDLGWGDVGFHGSNIKTPNLDKLAEDGIQMNRFYTAPISSPTRAGLMTGRYPTRFGLRDVVIPPWRDFGIDEEELFLPEMLANAGYNHRGLIGKWHLGHSRKAYYPLNNGFTFFYGHLNGAIDYFTHEREGQLDWHRNWDSSYDEGYATDLMTREGVNFIKEHAGNNEPFFLYIAYNAPHTPLQAKREDIVKYAPNFDHLSKKEQEAATYAAMVTCMDKGIGEIRQALIDMGIEDNTFFLFFSDNGAAPNGPGTNMPLRGNKFNEWDGGVRVPAIISYPAAFKGKRQVEQVTGFVDIMPTLKSLLSHTDNSHRPFDGVDISGILKNENEVLQRDFYLGCGAVVNNDYKFVLPARNGSMKLTEQFLSFYPDDPFEQQNVANQHGAEANRLRKIAEELDATEPTGKVLPYDTGREGFIPPFEWKVERE